MKNNGGTSNPDTAKATEATTIADKLIRRDGTHARGGSG